MSEGSYLREDKAIVEGDHKDTCPSCGSLDVAVIGKLPKATHFCTFKYSHSVNNSLLYKCNKCDLWYRNPCLSVVLLDELYAQQPESTWVASKTDRFDFKEVASSIGKYLDDTQVDTSLLDIGCFNGELISFLRSRKKIQSLKKYYGIEPSRRASEKCESDNIKVIGSSYRDIVNHAGFFNIITTIDVFEHIQDTHCYIDTISKKIKKGGVLIIITGATDSDQFSKIKNNYYYATMPEHLAFISKKHVKWLAKKSSMEIVDYKIFDRRMVKPSIVKVYMQNSLFLLAKVLPEKLLCKNTKIFRKIEKYKSKGIVPTRSNMDHAIITLKKL